MSFSAVPRIVQISATGGATTNDPDQLYALAEDGTLWALQNNNSKLFWVALPPLPLAGTAQVLFESTALAHTPLNPLNPPSGTAGTAGTLATPTTPITPGTPQASQASTEPVPAIPVLTLPPEPAIFQTLSTITPAPSDPAPAPSPPSSTPAHPHGLLQRIEHFLHPGKTELPSGPHTSEQSQGTKPE
jgi:hypothetical protein